MRALNSTSKSCVRLIYCDGRRTMDDDFVFYSFCCIQYCVHLLWPLLWLPDWYAYKISLAFGKGLVEGNNLVFHIHVSHLFVNYFNKTRKIRYFQHFALIALIREVFFQSSLWNLSIPCNLIGCFVYVRKWTNEIIMVKESILVFHLSA